MIPLFYIPTYHQEMLQLPSLSDKDRAAIVASLLRELDVQRSFMLGERDKLDDKLRERRETMRAIPDQCGLADKGDCMLFEWELKRLDAEVQSLDQVWSSHDAWLKEWLIHHG